MKTASDGFTLYKKKTARHRILPRIVKDLDFVVETIKKQNGLDQRTLDFLTRLELDLIRAVASL